MDIMDSKRKYSAGFSLSCLFLKDNIATLDIGRQDGGWWHWKLKAENWRELRAIVKKPRIYPAVVRTSDETYN